jgi:copper chaperone
MNTSVTTQFETTINCGSCIAKVSNTLNEMFGTGNWEVDTNNPNKILSIHAEIENENDLILKLADLGYAASKI